ncbi:hypothetical protein [Acaryochloris sp. IP29b_bin.137]|uniref:hypothetical protein n=1 Tax=Acaryochloris sp. IP29b_bin.137 TaxID=2969217 RepID=UPI00263522F0|nr:hypothetical protein [Acaryochloris sp. IP29b_bin.137]
MASTWIQRRQQVEREDLVMFINACLSCTGQREFYDDAWGQKLSLDFLHDYILGNYRLLYTRTLAAGINHFNQSQIILKLLATGQHIRPEHREEEGALIAASLNALPPQRAWKVLEQIRKRRINNRRTRAITRDYITQHQQRLDFDAVKYRSKVRAIATHNHLKLPGEVGSFLFRNWPQRFETSLFEQFRKAYYSQDAIYDLPFTVAEGLAAKHQIPRDRFLARIEAQMTQAEKVRMLQSTEHDHKSKLTVDLKRTPITKLALYCLSLSIQDRQERHAELTKALEHSAQAALHRAPLRLEKVATVLDCSYSSSGSNEKRRRPLGVALAVHYLLQAASADYQAFWTSSVSDPLLVQSRGQTDIATPLLDALDTNPDIVVILSDGWENDPPNGASEVLRVFRNHIDPSISILHCNPVFNADDFSVQALSPAIPTVGLRDAEDLPTVLGFAQFADGQSSLTDLEHYLKVRVQQFLATFHLNHGS